MAQEDSVDADGAPDKCQAAGRPVTVGDLAALYLERHAKVNKKTSSLEMDQRLLEQVILPGLAAAEVSTVAGGDIQHLHRQLRYYPAKANRVLALLSKMFNLAEDWGLRPAGSNPVKGIDRYPERGRQWVMTAEDFVRLWGALEEMQTAEAVLPTLPLAIKLILLLGCRKKEILALRWEHVNLREGYILLSEGKAGTHLVALPLPAIRLLRSAPRREGNPYVCWGQKSGQHLVGVNKFFAVVAARAGLGASLRLQDLRHVVNARHAWLSLI